MDSPFGGARKVAQRNPLFNPFAFLQMQVQQAVGTKMV